MARFVRTVAQVSRRALNRTRTEVENLLSAALRSEIDELKANALANWPIDTGKSARRLRFKWSRKVGLTAVTISNDAGYGQYVRRKGKGPYAWHTYVRERAKELRGRIARRLARIRGPIGPVSGGE